MRVALLLFSCSLTLLPIVWMVIVALSDSLAFLRGGTFHFTLDHVISLFTHPSLPFLSYFLNSIGISLITGVCATALAALAAYALSRFEFRGGMSLPAAVLALSMFPPICIVGALYQGFAKFALLNTWWALILPYTALNAPLALWILLSYFRAIPVEIDKAARVDGARTLTIITRVLLPLSLPGLSAAFLLVVIACFNEFLFALLLTIDSRAQTIPVGIALFEGVHGQTPWGQIMAAAAVASVPLIILTIVFQRFIIGGLLAGSVKE